MSEEKKGALWRVHTIPRSPVIGFVARRDVQGRDIVNFLQSELAPPKNKLVTLWGSGGVGKTALAAEAARALSDDFSGRIIWMSADARPNFSVLTLLDEIATRLGHPELRTLVPEVKSEQVRILITYSPTLIVLDNYETIAPDEQRRIEEWLAEVQCSTLFTSRHKISGTVHAPISAMSREEAEEFLARLIERTGAQQIFTSEIRRQIYEAAEANPFVMQWVVAQISLEQEPSAVLKELSEGKGAAATRIFDRSFNLPQFSDAERNILLALALFTPSATRDALAEVSGLEDTERLKEGVENLVRLWLVEDLEKDHRLAVQGLTRALASARLSSDSRVIEFRSRFVRYFLRYAIEHSGRTPEDFDALEEEKDNLFNAAEIASASEAWREVIQIANVLASPVSGMLSVRGYWDEAIRLGEQALQAARFSQDERVVARFSHNLAVMYGERGEVTKARQLYDESLEIAKRLGTQNGIAITLHQLAMLAQDQGQLEEARRLYDESLEIKKRLGDQHGVAGTLHQLAMLAQDQGQLEEARRLYDESLEIAKRLGDQRSVAGTLHQLGNVAYLQSELEEARRLYDESLEIKKRLGDQHGVASTLGQLGYLAEGNGDKAEAARLFSQALSIFERLGSPYAELTRQKLKRVEGSVTEDDG